jgi:hypothetical protein
MSCRIFHWYKLAGQAVSPLSCMCTSISDLLCSVIGRVGSVSALTAADRGLSQPPPDKCPNNTSNYINIFVSLST